MRKQEQSHDLQLKTFIWQLGVVEYMTEVSFICENLTGGFVSLASGLVKFCTTAQTWSIIDNSLNDRHHKQCCQQRCRRHH